MNTENILAFVKKRRQIIPVLVTVLLIDYWVYEKVALTCHQEILSENYDAGAVSCRRALVFGWPFQSIRTGQYNEYNEVLTDLATAELYLRRLQSAREHLSEALQRYKEEMPGGSNGYAVTLNNMAVLSRYEGDLKSQLKWSQASVEMFNALRASCNPAALQANSSLASALNTLGNSREAEIVVAAGINKYAGCQNISPYIRGSAFRILGEVQTKNGQDELSVSSLNKAIGLYREARGDSSLELGYGLLSRAMALRQLNRLDECKDDVMKAIPILESYVGQNAKVIGDAKIILGNALRDQGRYEEALSEYHAAEKIYAVNVSYNHPSRASLLINMSKALRGLGRYEESTPLLREAKRIRTIVFGGDSSQVEIVQEMLDSDNG